MVAHSESFLSCFTEFDSVSFFEFSHTFWFGFGADSTGVPQNGQWLANMDGGRFFCPLGAFSLSIHPVVRHGIGVSFGNTKAYPVKVRLFSRSLSSILFRQSQFIGLVLGRGVTISF
jgi:hypothetical protein